MMAASTPRVLLLSPPYNPAKVTPGEALGIKYLGAVLRQRGMETLCLDTQIRGQDDDMILQAAAGFQPDYAGISVHFTSQLDQGLDYAREIKKILPGVHIGMGGYGPSTFWQRILAENAAVDTVVIGEGERTLPELLEHLHQPEAWHAIAGLAYRNGGTPCAAPPRALITDLDSLPFPLRDDPARFLGRGHFAVLSSRGCPLNCAFCSTPLISAMGVGPRWRARSAANMVDELQALCQQLGAHTFTFADDNFLGSRPAGLARGRAIADEIVRRGLKIAMSFQCCANDVSADLFAALKAAGLWRVYMGAESSLDHILKLYHKHLTAHQIETAVNVLRQLDIEVFVYFIPFHPDTTLDEIEQVFAFIDRLDLGTPFAVTNKITPDFGTHYYRRLLQEGRLINNSWFNSFYFNDWRVEALHRLLKMALEPFEEAVPTLQKLGYSYQKAQALLSKRIMACCAEGLAVVRTAKEMNVQQVFKMGLKMQGESTLWLLDVITRTGDPSGNLP
jgi:anaerobic magnesium-protoporphyrin IX monomethyl ester cyclase